MSQLIVNQSYYYNQYQCPYQMALNQQIASSTMQHPNLYQILIKIYELLIISQQQGLFLSKQIIQMSKTILNGRAMSVSNWNQTKQVSEATKKISNHTRPSSAIGSQLVVPNIKEIYSIFQLHFPQSTMQLNKNGFAHQNIIQNVNKMLKQIKKQHQKRIANMQAEYRNMQMELKLVRDSRDQIITKNKKLEEELNNTNQKMKCKQLDCFSKNEQIFQAKQRIEQMQKQLLVRNLEIQKAYDEWSKYKMDMNQKLQYYASENYNLQVQLKRSTNQIQKQKQNVSKVQADLRRQLFEKQKLIKITLTQPKQQNREFVHNLQRDRSSSSFSKSHNRSRVERAVLSTEDLLDEVKQLRENQSALLDRLAERDKLIQTLQNSLSNSISQ